MKFQHILLKTNKEKPSYKTYATNENVRMKMDPEQPKIHLHFAPNTIKGS